jgi:hypothetical protein
MVFLSHLMEMFGFCLKSCNDRFHSVSLYCNFITDFSFQQSKQCKLNLQMMSLNITALHVVTFLTQCRYPHGGLVHSGMSLQNEAVFYPWESNVLRHFFQVPHGGSRQKLPVRVRFIVIQIHLQTNTK